ncbi:DMT family transporter [Anaeropeptidivorans aminofermentans]|jgi:drug/metabolite transporter (DMT)-like permease|uniref:DMT family transporter n=1 Tax=Anaeropeptidivorans aminofermentans TaxID=2934315 RepID=UPI0020254614|nr:DMT family transporter [Anaeropeptidivorans aminofermentans]MBE6011976.1 DMT family transporter [Lachnospiraceae bacterium]
MKKLHKAILYIVLSALSFALMNVFVKLSGDFPSFQKVFIRSLVVLFFSTIVLLKNKERPFPKKENAMDMFWRSFAGCVSMICNYYAVDHLILSDATMISKIAPFCTIIFSFLILKESVKVYQIICILIGFAGTAFIVKPALNSTIIPAFVGVLGAVLAGVAYTFVRKLGNKGEENGTIVFSFALFSALFNIPFLVTGYEHVDLYNLFILIISGFFAFLGQMFVTGAYSLAPARDISIFDFSQLIFAAITGYFIFSEKPDLYSFLGYMVILGTSFYLFKKNKAEAQKEQTEPAA